MSGKKTSKIGRVRAIFAGFLVLMGILTGVGSAAITSENVYAVPGEDGTTTEVTTDTEDVTEDGTENKTDVRKIGKKS